MTEPHDKIRETVVGHLSKDRLRAIHRNIGETIERNENVSVENLYTTLQRQSLPTESQLDTPGRVYDLALHFDAAGVKNKALVYSLLAAEHAKRQFAIDVSLTLFLKAETLAHEQLPVIRYRIASGRGATLLLAGKYSDAHATFDNAIKLADTETERIWVKSKYAEIAYQAGSLSKRMSIYEGILKTLGIKVRRSRMGLVWDICWFRILDVIRSTFSVRSQVIPSETDSNFVSTLQTLQGFARPCCFRDPLLAIWSISKSGILADRNSDPALRCSLKSHQGWILGILCCEEEQARHSFSEAFQIAQELNDLPLQARSAFLRSATLANLGCFDDALREIESSRTLYLQIGDQYYATFSRYIRSLISSRLGNVNACVCDASHAFQNAVITKQYRLAQSAVAPWSIATNGNFP